MLLLFILLVAGSNIITLTKCISPYIKLLVSVCAYVPYDNVDVADAIYMYINLDSHVTWGLR